MSDPFGGLPIARLVPGVEPACPACGSTAVRFVAFHGDLTRFLMRCECTAPFLVFTSRAQDAAPAELRALVVEPHDDTRDLYCAVLMHNGLAVMSAASAQEGLDALASWRPSLVSTELRLPDTDGLAFCRGVRSSAEGLVPAIAVVTAETRATRLAAARSLADLVLVKPCSVDDYVARLTRLAKTKASVH